MPSNSESPEINFCASVLAKAVAKEDSDAFAVCHDAFGNLYDKETLKKIEDLANQFTSLPPHIIDSKINWLRSLGVEPIDVNAIFENKTPAAKCAPGKKSNQNMPDCENSAKNEVLPTPSVKSQNRKSKKKKKNAELRQKGQDSPSTVSEINTAVKEIEDIANAIAAEAEKAGESSESVKRKKKKKKKKGKQSQEANTEHPKEEAPISQKMLECKSPVETPLFDSGIGSCVASGGEDKLSVLSGGTIESIGENAEAVSQKFNFEADPDSNEIREYLEKNGPVVSEEVRDDNRKGNNTDSDLSKNVVSFGAPNFVEIKKFVELEEITKSNISKSCKNVLTNNKNSGPEAWRAEKTANGERDERYRISFDVTTTESVNEHTDINAKIFPVFRDVQVRGDFDHAATIQFLMAEWRKTLANPNAIRWKP